MSAILCAFVASYCPAHAELPDTISGQTLKPLEVTGSATPDSKRSVAATHIIDSKSLDKLGIVELTDALRRMPGINLRDYGGAGGLKTVSVRGLGTQHTGVCYDGAPLSDVQTGQIDLSRYSLQNVSSLSMVSGDNEDLFTPARTSASATSLVISSWRPDAFGKPFSLTAQLKGGAFGYVSPYLRIGAANGRNLAFLMAADFTRSDNSYPYTIKNVSETMHLKRRNSGLTAGHVEANLQWLVARGTTLGFKGYYYDSFRHLPGPAVLYNDESHESLKDINVFGQATLRSRLSRIFSIKALAKFNWSRSNYRDRNGKYPGGTLDNLYDQREAYATASLLCTPLSGLNLSYAFDYFYNDLRSNLKQHNHPHRNSVLQALSVRYRLDWLTVTAKALLSVYGDTPGDGEKSLRHSRLSPSAGLAFRPWSAQELFFRLNYKNIFRMPSFNELYFDHYGSINLDPESTDQFNVGVSYSAPSLNWMSTLDITADAYFNRVKNKIVAVPYNMFVWTMTNLGHVNAYGMDMTLFAEFPIVRNHSIVLSGNYSLQMARARTSRDMLDWNKQLPYTPEHTGSFSVTWENPWVSVGWHGTGSSCRYATRENVPSSRLPGYMEFGFTAYHTFRFRTHELELRADLINAFNRHYEIVARYPMPGRSWQASIRFTI